MLVLAREASAETPRVTLRWTAPEGCPAGTRVVAEVDRLLGGAGARPPKPLDVIATVTADASAGLNVHIETAGEGGTRVRELHAASCDALADATALILALMIDPAAVTSAPPPPAPPPPPPRPAPPAPPAPPPPSRHQPRFHVVAWVLADGGSLPGVSFAAEGGVAVSLGAVRLEGGAAVFPVRAAVIPERPTTGGDISLITGSVGACYGVVRGAFEVGPCAAIELGRLHASGFGMTKPGEGNALWSAARPGVRLAWWPVARFGLALRADAAIPFERPNFVLKNVGTVPVFRSGPAAGRLGVGAEVRF